MDFYSSPMYQFARPYVYKKNVFVSGILLIVSTPPILVSFLNFASHNHIPVFMLYNHKPFLKKLFTKQRGLITIDTGFGKKPLIDYNRVFKKNTGNSSLRVLLKMHLQFRS